MDLANRQRNSPIRRHYTPENFQTAIGAILSGKIMQATACRLYNIPRSTITSLFRKRGIYLKELKNLSAQEINLIVHELTLLRYGSNHTIKPFDLSQIHINKDYNKNKKQLITKSKNEKSRKRSTEKSATPLMDCDIPTHSQLPITPNSETSSKKLPDLKPYIIHENSSTDLLVDKNAFEKNKKKSIVLISCGSFNPITNMHLRMFEIAKDYINEHFPGYEVEKGIISPVSDGYNKTGLVKSLHRVNMCNLAVQDSSWITVSGWEASKPNWIPTLDVLTHHAEEFNANLEKEDHKSVMMLCGADLLESFNKPGLWKKEDMHKILSDFGVLVISRGSINPEKLIYENDFMYSLKECIHVVTNWIENEISSTKIRRALRRNQNIRYLIPDTVIDYISEFCLYQKGSEEINEGVELAAYEQNKLIKR